MIWSIFQTNWQFDGYILNWTPAGIKFKFHIPSLQWSSFWFLSKQFFSIHVLHPQLHNPDPFTSSQTFRFLKFSPVYSPSPNQDRPAVLSRIVFWFLLQKVNDVGINHVCRGGVQYNDGLIPRCNNKACFCKIAVFYVIVANPLPAYKLVPPLTT